MDKFHLYFAVGTKQYCEFLLICNVKNILISFVYQEPWQLKPMLERNNCNILCDSGAFTAWNQAQNKKREGDPNWEKCLIDIDAYAEHLEKYKDFIFRGANLDVIPGEQGVLPTEEQCIEAAESGWNNYLYLKKKGHDTIHIYHQGEPLRFLERMIKHCDYIGISPNNDFSQKRKMVWMDHVFRYIANSSNPKIKTHGFAVTSRSAVLRYPWFSTDSATYSLTAAMGRILSKHGRIMVSDQDKGHKDHIGNKPIKVQEYINDYIFSRTGYKLKSLFENKEVEKCSCPHCHEEVEQLSKTKCYKARNFANIVFLQELAEETNRNGCNHDYKKQQTLL